LQIDNTFSNRTVFETLSHKYLLGKLKRKKKREKFILILLAIFTSKSGNNNPNNTWRKIQSENIANMKSLSCIYVAKLILNVQMEKFH
jgi:hypothetical protein